MKNRVIVTVSENGNVQVTTNDSTMNAIIVDYRDDRSEGQPWEDSEDADCSMMVDTCYDPKYVNDMFAEFAGQTADSKEIEGFKKWMEAYGIEESDVCMCFEGHVVQLGDYLSFDDYLKDLFATHTSIREIKDKISDSFSLREI